MSNLVRGGQGRIISLPVISLPANARGMWDVGRMTGDVGGLTCRAIARDIEGVILILCHRTPLRQFTQENACLHLILQLIQLAIIN